MSSYLPFNLPLIHRPRPLQALDNLCLFPATLSKSSSLHSLSKSQICFAFSPSTDSNHDREEERWLREEQRWLREEQRWLRQELRWNAERESLLRKIQALTLRIEELERQNSVQGASLSETVLKDVELGKKVNRIAESGSTALSMVVEGAERRQMEEAVFVKEVLQISEEVNKRKTLRTGSEGDEVRAMQEALQKLGFYSGEEDVEYSSFSSGTERAVKTWQAALGVPEDGIMTAHLLERLYSEQQIGTSGSTVKTDPKRDNLTIPRKESTNGAAVNSISEILETQHVKGGGGGGGEEVEVSQHRVFLLGENRWEEPSRLDGAKRVDAKMCLSCRGEGRLVCTECDGTGEPNVEPQFLEWVDEGMKCPYCEGMGYTICDICQGKTVIPP